MTNHIDHEKYQDFVQAVTSEASNDLSVMIRRLQELDDHPNLNISLLMTAAIGLASEGGEFDEIVKKMVFQDKPYTEENRFHMKRELGDIIFYWANACRALGYNPNDVIAENVNKLSKRYPNGFSAERSENRAIDDI